MFFPLVSCIHVANPEHLEAAKEMVKALELTDEDRLLYKNPALQKHTANLEAIALDKEEPDLIVDKSLGDAAFIQAAQPLIQVFETVS